ALHNTFQIVNIIQEHVVKLPDRWIDITRHRYIYNEQWPVRPLLHTVLHLRRCYDITIRPGRADQNIDVLQSLHSFLHRARDTVELGCQLLCTAEGTVSHKHLCRPASAQMLRRQLAHFAGAEDKHLLALEAAEYPLAQFNSGITYRYGAFADRCLRMGSLA